MEDLSLSPTRGSDAETEEVGGGVRGGEEKKKIEVVTNVSK